ncbi:MAG: T9SS type A sorting domain-containing protein [Flavobacteriaceae bacterium]
MINESCVDTTNDGFYDTDVDLNNDNEIQVSEALNVLKLEIYDFNDDYLISSLLDINSFTNLNNLRIVANDNIEEISNLSIDSLSSLIISECYNLRIIDLSSLTNLSDLLGIEYINNIDYLNIQNGSVSELFYIFYSSDILYACVDNIAEEYNEVSWNMVSDPPTTDNCTVLNVNTENHLAQFVDIFPNPTTGIIQIDAKEEPITKIELYSKLGHLVFVKEDAEIHSIDISNLDNGIYFLKISSQNNFKGIKKIIKNK